jgi:hypothetical protein
LSTAGVAAIRETLWRDGGIFDRLEWERAAQYAKFGDQSHLPNGTGYAQDHADAVRARDACEQAFADGRGTWRHILLEEIHEALDEVVADKLRAELIQVAAVAVAWIEALDRRSG